MNKTSTSSLEVETEQIHRSRPLFPDDATTATPDKKTRSTPVPRSKRAKLEPRDLNAGTAEVVDVAANLMAKLRSVETGVYHLSRSERSSSALQSVLRVIEGKHMVIWQWRDRLHGLPFATACRQGNSESQ